MGFGRLDSAAGIISRYCDEEGLGGLMYHACYLFRVPREKVDQFLRISGEAAEIYRRYGAVGGSVVCVTDGASKYGCVGLADLVRAGEGEELFVGMDSFADVEQFRTLMPKIDTDPRVGELFKEIQEVVELGRVVRWEGEQAGGGRGRGG